MARTQKSSVGDAPPLAGGNGRLLPILIVLSGLLLIAVAVAGYFYYQYKNAQPGVAETKEINELQATLGVFMELPEGETPTLATVTDKAKLADQPFFKKAENGDKVLIYTNHGRAILYRPSIKKIIDVTAVNVTPPTDDNGNPQPTAQNTPTAPATVSPATTTTLRTAIYNGSGQSGAATNLEKELQSTNPNITVTSKSDASRSYSDKYIVADVTGKNTDAVQKIATSIDGKVALLPEGEKIPADTDVAIFIGTGE
ncbi:MAG: LytR C-terminal domain-containing protein [Candidatus Moraniibacteriota bacterium]